MAYKQKNNPFKSRKSGPLLQGPGFGQEMQPLKPTWNKGKIEDDDEEYKEKSTLDKIKDLKLHEVEKDVDEYLGHPLDKAQKISDEMGGEFYDMEEGDIDRIRHTMAAAYTSNKVGVIGANLLGLAHEAIAPNTPSEHKSDLINNAIGSVVGSIPFIDEDQMVSTVKWLNDRGWLSSYEHKEGEKRRKDYLNPNRVEVEEPQFDLKALIERLEKDLEEEEE